MKRNWYLHLSKDIWVEFWDEIPNATISVRFTVSNNKELIKSEIRLLPNKFIKNKTKSIKYNFRLPRNKFRTF